MMLVLHLYTHHIARDILAVSSLHPDLIYMDIIMVVNNYRRLTEEVPHMEFGFFISFWGSYIPFTFHKFVV
jgi:hypothetical protein